MLHDYGKIYTYEKKGDKWDKTADYTKSLHIVKSVEKAKEFLAGKVSTEMLDRIVHCIAAHHGRKEWGALEEPRTSEAWMLHLADMTSVFCIANRPNS